MNYSKKNNQPMAFNAVNRGHWQELYLYSEFSYVNGNLLLVEQAPLKICEKIEEIVAHLGKDAYWTVLYENNNVLLTIAESNILPGSFSPSKLITQFKTICVHLRHKLSQKELSQVYWEGSIIFSIVRDPECSPERLIQGMVAADDPLITICYYEETLEIVSINVDQ